MTSMKTMMVVLLTVLFGLLLISQSSHAEIYKWVDEKGTVHFTEDPATIPEKYREKVESRTTEEDSMTPAERIKANKIPEEDIREKLKQEKREEKVKKIRGTIKDHKSIKDSREFVQETSSQPSPGFIPHDKFIHLTEGMTEAEVLSRFGEPTRVVEDEAKVSGGTIDGFVSPGGALTGTVSERRIEVIKRYYYIGDKNKGEKTTIIHFRRGRVVKYERI
jgi:hypothetical protein